MNMSGAVGDETRRRVANVVHDDGDDHYDEELDPPAANGGVVVVVVVGCGDRDDDLGDIDDDDAPPSESSSLIAPSPPSSSHGGDLCRRLHPRGDGQATARALSETPSRPLLHLHISDAVPKRLGPGEVTAGDRVGGGGSRRMGVQCREDITAVGGGGPSGGSRARRGSAVR
jgi:hypothetical protein